MTPEQMRQVMPMTRYWAIKQGIKKGAEAVFAPMTFMFRLAADSLETMAKHLQHAVFHKDAK